MAGPALVRRTLTLVLAVVFLSSTLVVQAAPLRQLPAISTSPNSGPVGTVVSVYGSDYLPGGYEATLRWDGVDQFTFFIEAGGAFKTSFSVPGDAAPGKHSLTVCAACGQGDVEQSASTTFEVTAESPTHVPGPVINSFAADSAKLSQGQCTTLRWEAFNASSVYLDDGAGQQGVGGVDNRSVCPAKTTTYTLFVNAQKGGTPDSVTAQVLISVAALVPTPTPTAGIIVPPVILTVAPVIAAPTVCTSVDLGPGAQVINFDELRPGDSVTNQYPLHFVPGSAYIGRPAVAAHSGAQAVRSHYDDFGSASQPISFSFWSYRVLGAVGLYVGREAPDQDREPLFATLTAFGYDASGAFVTVGSGETMLPAAATPIQRCLVVRAPAGQGIRSATLEYTTAGGDSGYDLRWMDDLTYLPSTDFGARQPPTVSIVIPANGSTAATDSVTLRALIHEDVALRSVTYSPNGGPAQPMLFHAVVGADPTLYEAIATVPPSRLRADQSNSIRVLAADSDTLTGEDTTTFRYSPSAVGDIWVTGIEVSQAVQSPDNRVPLIGLKRTVVRVYVRSVEDARGVWGDVTARLTVRGGARNQVLLPSTADPRAAIVVSPSGSDHDQYADSFNFLLPSEQTGVGERQLEVTISSISRRPETNAANNTASLRIKFEAPIYRSLYAFAHGVCDAAGTVTTAPPAWSLLEGQRRYTENIFPVSGLSISPLLGNPTPCFITDGAARADQRANAWAMTMIDRQCPGGGCRIFTFNPIIPERGGQSGWCCNDTRLGNKVLNGDTRYDATDQGIILGQELAHSYGPAWHTFDPTPYPWRDERVHQTGVKTYPSGIVIRPASNYDILSYAGSNIWISPYTYCLLVRGVSGGGLACPAGAEMALAPAPAHGKIALDVPTSARLAAPRRQSKSGYVQVNGWLLADGTAALEPFRVVSDGAGQAGAVPGPTYHVTLEGPAGEIRVEAFFDLPAAGTHPVESESRFFSLLLPFDPAATRIVLRRGDTVLAERLVSPNAPKLRILSPQGGETWSGLQIIRWEAADADGDALTYFVDFSPDGGATWVPLGSQLTSPKLDVNFDLVPGAEAGLIRVSATDGVNTTVEQATGAVHVSAHSPQISLTAPAEGDSFFQNQPFTAEASAFDWEDGPLSEPAFYSWSSDRDGALGAGPWIVLGSLSAGEHTLTVTVNDSQKNVATASVHVTIVGAEDGSAAPTPTLTPPAAPDTGRPAWVYWVGGAAVLIGLFIIRLALRRRA